MGYMFLRERLKALKDGWEEVHQMWENRQQLLSQSLNLQMFNRDAKQAEVLLSQQEHLLSKDETPSNLEQAESLIKKHEALLTTMEANDDKVNGVLQFAQRLVSEQHFASEKISKKAEDISERRNNNHELALAQLEKLRDQLLLHQALQSEIACNKERLDQVENSGAELLKTKAEMSNIIQEKLSQLSSEFDKLQTDTQEKGEKSFDAKRADLYEQSCDDIDCFVKDLEEQIKNEPVGNDLTSVNILMQKQQMIETQTLIKSQQVTELDSQADHLARMTPEKQEEIDQKKEAVAKKFASIIEPLEVRKKELEVKKEVFQFMRDVEDENIWMEEKMNLVTSEELGSSLQDVNMLIKKNKTLKGEIENHEHRIMSVCNVGQKLIDESHPESSEFTRQINDLMEKLEHLKHNLEARNVKLLRSEKVQQFFFDANEAEAWMSEQELYMMVEDRGKDEFSAQNLMKKHKALETAVADYSDDVRQLGETARQLIADEHPKK